MGPEQEASVGPSADCQVLDSEPQIAALRRGTAAKTADDQITTFDGALFNVRL